MRMLSALLFAAALLFALASCAAAPPETVCISEAMPRNASILPDENGAFGDKFLRFFFAPIVNRKGMSCAYQMHCH